MKNKRIKGTVVCYRESKEETLHSVELDLRTGKLYWEGKRPIGDDLRFAGFKPDPGMKWETDWDVCTICMKAIIGVTHLRKGIVLEEIETCRNKKCKSHKENDHG